MTVHSRPMVVMSEEETRKFILAKIFDRWTLLHKLPAREAVALARATLVASVPLRRAVSGGIAGLDAFKKRIVRHITSTLPNMEGMAAPSDLADEIIAAYGLGGRQLCWRLNLGMGMGTIMDADGHPGHYVCSAGDMAWLTQFYQSHTKEPIKATAAVLVANGAHFPKRDLDRIKKIMLAAATAFSKQAIAGTRPGTSIGDIGLLDARNHDYFLEDEDFCAALLEGLPGVPANIKSVDPEVVGRAFSQWLLDVSMLDLAWVGATIKPLLAEERRHQSEVYDVYYARVGGRFELGNLKYCEDEDEGCPDKEINRCPVQELMQLGIEIIMCYARLLVMLKAYGIPGSVPADLQDAYKHMVHCIVEGIRLWDAEDAEQAHEDMTAWAAQETEKEYRRKIDQLVANTETLISGQKVAAKHMAGVMANLDQMTGMLARTSDKQDMINLQRANAEQSAQLLVAVQYMANIERNQIAQSASQGAMEAAIRAEFNRWLQHFKELLERERTGAPLPIPEPTRAQGGAAYLAQDWSECWTLPTS
mmetsp:Transcript_3024/g.7522  ORF Transcript_3024/g.7522 Transcript_3024/m.7522 type:complete len:534 (-) Transcript_3024:767-2368(-)